MCIRDRSFATLFQQNLDFGNVGICNVVGWSNSNRKRKLEEICAENPDIKEKLSVRDIVRRPNLEKYQPLLLKTIVDIAMYGNAADAKRRTETIRSVKTLD